jgi:uncharacterized protein (TIGR02391 family)
MEPSLEQFQELARELGAKYFVVTESDEHVFDVRNIHPGLPEKVKQLFDDGHYAEATFEACKFLDNFVKKHAPNTKSGQDRMMRAFDEGNPLIKLTGLATDSEKDEQKGYKFLFAGMMVAVRNPRGHEDCLIDDPSTSLDHLGMISALLRRLNKAGYPCQASTTVGAKPSRVGQELILKATGP